MFENTFATFYDVKAGIDGLTKQVADAADSVGLGGTFRTPGPTAESFTPPAPTPSEQETFVSDPNAGIFDRVAGALGLPTKTVKMGFGGLILLLLLVAGKRLIFKRSR